MTTIILAGGKGTRLSSVVSDVPKPLIPVAGQPFLHWLVRWVREQGENDIIIAARHLHKQVERWVDSEISRACLEVVVESEPLDTGGAVLFAAARRPGEDCLVLNGDSITFVSLKCAQDALAADPTLDGVIVAVAIDDAARYGSLEIGKNGLLSGFVEKRPGAGMVNAGMYMLRAGLLSGRAIDRTSMEQDLFPAWLRAGKRFAVAVSHAPFIDIGTPETLAAATAFIERHMAYFDRPESFPSAELVKAAADA